MFIRIWAWTGTRTWTWTQWTQTWTRTWRHWNWTRARTFSFQPDSDLRVVDLDFDLGLAIGGLVTSLDVTYQTNNAQFILLRRKSWTHLLTCIIQSAFSIAVAAKTVNDFIGLIICQPLRSSTMQFNPCTTVIFTSLKQFANENTDWCYTNLLLLARDSICYSALHAIARPSVRLSVWLTVTRVDQSKMVEVRIMQPSPQSSPMTSFLTLNFTVKFQREHRERGRQIREGYEKYAIFSQ